MIPAPFRPLSVPAVRAGRILCPLIAGLLVAFVGLRVACAQQRTDLTAYTVTVAGAGIERHATVVSFPLPVASAPEAYHLEAPSGSLHPLQVGPERAWFVVDSLGANRERTYHVKAGRVPTDSVIARRRENTVDISMEETPILRYWTNARPAPSPSTDPIFERGGYLHPVRTPSGRIVTGDYPLDHKHHHGIWSAWTNTRFRGRAPDFWNMGAGTGAVTTMALDSVWSGAVHAGLQARHRYVDRTGTEPVTALYEEWTLRVYHVASGEPLPDHRVFDLTVRQSTASASPLTLPTYHYGGVAVRGPDAWYGADNARFLTSTGRDRSNGNESRAHWTYFGGAVDGALAGIAMLGHPSNFRAPQPLRIHPEMPYFTFAPSQLGTWSISPGRPYKARYRFVTLDGRPAPDVLDRLWRDYAYPPTVTIHGP